MNLGEYIQYRNRKSPSAILNEVVTKSKSQLKSKITEEECAALQKFLNEVLYPEKNGASVARKAYHQNLMQRYAQAFEQQNNVVLDNFDISNLTQTYSGGDGDAIISRYLYDSLEHKERINISTLKNRLDKVSYAIENLSIVNPAERERVSNELNQLQTLLTQVLEEYIPDSKGYFKFDANDGLSSKINVIDSLYSSLSSIGGSFTPLDYGNALEGVLAAVGADFANNDSEKIGDQLISDILAGKGTGQKRTSEKGGLISLSTKFDAKDFNTKKAHERTTQKKFQVGKGNTSVKFNLVKHLNPYSERQGKMDIELTLNIPEVPDSTFRISAKNWKSFKNRDFGTTALAYSLIRSLGEENTIQYMYAMQNPKDNSIVQGYHQIAKYATLIDILQGFSQESDYVDTIVINNRSEQKVVVFSILSILNKISDNLDTLQIQGYNDSEIHTTIINIRKALANTDNLSKNFESLCHSYLYSIKVAVSFANIQSKI